MLPEIVDAKRLLPNRRRLFIAAYGFEDRSLGWVTFQRDSGSILEQALLFHYEHSKGSNKIASLGKAISNLGVGLIKEVPYDLWSPHSIEDSFSRRLDRLIEGIDEIVIDISAMTKLMILVCLCKLSKYSGTIRLVYSEAEDYAPSLEEYTKSKERMESAVNFPSRGFGTIVRTKCLSSIRMQGQPVSMVAFTSFNEQLVRHMLGTISPHRLLFINGRPPCSEYSWREHATQEIHQKLISEYTIDNVVDESGLLIRSASTLDYRETYRHLEDIYRAFGAYERIIIAATGSKMQMIGLFICKTAHPDVHVEYPTPDSYFVKGMSSGIKKVHEVVFSSFTEIMQRLLKKNQ